MIVMFVYFLLKKSSSLYVDKNFEFVFLVVFYFYLEDHKVVLLNLQERHVDGNKS